MASLLFHPNHNYISGYSKLFKTTGKLICHRAKTLHPLSAGPGMALASMNIMVFMTATLHGHGHEGVEPGAAGAQRALATEGVICLRHIKKKKEKKKRYNSGI